MHKSNQCFCHLIKKKNSIFSPLEFTTFQCPVLCYRTDKQLITEKFKTEPTHTTPPPPPQKRKEKKKLNFYTK